MTSRAIIRTTLCLAAMIFSITACGHAQRREWTAKNIYEAVANAEAEKDSWK